VEGQWISWARLAHGLPKSPEEIKPHPHGVELGMLMQMLRDTESRTLRSALSEDFSRVSSQTALDICTRAGLEPKANPRRIANREVETLYKAVNDTKLMRPPTDCLSPIGEELIVAGLAKEIEAEFCTAVTRDPTVYRGNPFQVEVGIAYAKPGGNTDGNVDDPVRVMRFANRVPLLYMAGACAVTKAISGVNWKNYGLPQPRGGLPLGPMVIMVHIASVWVPFTSESKEAIAHYPEIIKEIGFCVQECGRRLSVHLSRRNREAEAERKRSYIEKYIPHLALGLKDVLDLSDRDEGRVVDQLKKMLERTHLEV
jgi:DNA topoisomerase-6 subunit B